MLRRWTAALMLASAVTAAPLEAARAQAQAAGSFEAVPRPQPPRTTHRAAWACALAGIGLVAASFPLSDMADRRYEDYLTETDPLAIEGRYQSVRRADRLASASLLAGEAFVVSAVYLRFVRRPHAPRAALLVEPGRCAIAVRF